MPDVIDELFRTTAVSGSVSRFLGDMDDPAVALYEAGDKLNPPGDAVKWDEERYTRGIATTAGPDSPTKQAKKPQITPRTSSVVYVKEHVDIKAREAHQLRAAGQDNPDAQQVVTKALRNLAKRIFGAKRYMAWKTLQGTLAFASMPNSELAHSVDWSANSVSMSKTAAWNLAATKIRSTELGLMRRQFKKKVGLPARRALATTTLEDYLIANTEAQAFMANMAGAQVLTDGTREQKAELIRRFGGIDWKFADEHYALDASEDTETDLQTSDEIFFLPSEEEDEDIFFRAEGLNYLPSGPVIAGSPNVAALTTVVRGAWVYVEVVTNPLTYRIHGGWTGLYGLKRTNSYMRFDAV